MHSSILFLNGFYNRNCGIEIDSIECRYVNEREIMYNSKVEIRNLDIQEQSMQKIKRKCWQSEIVY